MKRTLQLFCLAILLLNIDNINATCYAISNYNMLKSNVKIKRTFKNPYLYSKAHSNSFTKRNNNASKKDTDVQITFSDFQNHFEIGRERIAIGANNPLIMNIGSIDSGIHETWVLPDFTKNNNSKSLIIDQIDAKSTDLYDIYGYGTNAFYSKDANIYELFDLNEDELFLIAYDILEDGEWNEYDRDQTKVPIPVENGLEHTSIVRYEEEENPEDNYLEYTDVYYVIGQGTLQTFDDGNAEALKMIYKEEERVVEDGIITSFETRYEIVFYSKNGHYISADIDDPWNAEGEVSLDNFIYQKLESKTASVKDDLLTSTKTFPNPITAGEMLTIESPVSLASSNIIVYNVNGQKMANLTFSKGNNNQYQVTVPTNLAKGIYFYKLNSEDGNVLKNGKIQIQ